MAEIKVGEERERERERERENMPVQQHFRGCNIFYTKLRNLRLFPSMNQRKIFNGFKQYHDKIILF
jgi:hypothetical protein